MSERVVVVSKIADLRIKLVDHLADERWRVRTGCVAGHRLVKFCYGFSSTLRQPLDLVVLGGNHGQLNNHRDRVRRC